MHRKHLSRDRTFARVLLATEEIRLEKRNKIYLRLCSSILSQQLNVKVARVLYQRFLNLYGRREPALQQILDTPQSAFLDIGFSRAKSNYIHNVCAFFAENKITDKKLHSLADEEVITLLTRIKGVGRWTAEMILIFSLGREDIFPIDDLGVRTAMIELYKIEESDRKKLNERLDKIAGKWSPYRSYAARYLWMWKDGGGL